MVMVVIDNKINRLKKWKGVDGNQYSITGRTTRTGKKLPYILHLM